MNSVIRCLTSAVLGSALLLSACQSSPEINFDLERKAILELHELQRQNHFQKDSVSFANQISENFISVNRGLIKSPTFAENKARYHAYFQAVEFLKWDDVSEPIIRFSDDGSLAYSIVDKMVSVKYLGEEGDSIIDSTHFAWTAIYKKYNGQWKVDCVTSTQIPEE